MLSPRRPKKGRPAPHQRGDAPHLSARRRQKERAAPHQGGAAPDFFGPPAYHRGRGARCGRRDHRGHADGDVRRRHQGGPGEEGREAEGEEVGARHPAPRDAACGPSGGIGGPSSPQQTAQRALPARSDGPYPAPMPTLEHNGLVEMFRENPSLAPHLVAILFRVELLLCQRRGGRVLARSDDPRRVPRRPGARATRREGRAGAGDRPRGPARRRPGQEVHVAGVRRGRAGEEAVPDGRARRRAGRRGRHVGRAPARPGPRLRDRGSLWCWGRPACPRSRTRRSRTRSWSWPGPPGHRPWQRAERAPGGPGGAPRPSSGSTGSTPRSYFQIVHDALREPVRSGSGGIVHGAAG